MRFIPILFLIIRHHNNDHYRSTVRAWVEKLSAYRGKRKPFFSPSCQEMTMIGSCRSMSAPKPERVASLFLFAIILYFASHDLFLVSLPSIRLWIIFIEADAQFTIHICNLVCTVSYFAVFG